MQKSTRPNHVRCNRFSQSDIFICALYEDTILFLELYRLCYQCLSVQERGDAVLRLRAIFTICLMCGSFPLPLEKSPYAYCAQQNTNKRGTSSGRTLAMKDAQIESLTSKNISKGRFLARIPTCDPPALRRQYWKPYRRDTSKYTRRRRRISPNHGSHADADARADGKEHEEEPESAAK